MGVCEAWQEGVFAFLRIPALSLENRRIDRGLGP